MTTSSKHIISTLAALLLVSCPVFLVYYLGANQIFTPKELVLLGLALGGLTGVAAGFCLIWGWLND